MATFIVRGVARNFVWSEGWVQNDGKRGRPHKVSCHGPGHVAGMTCLTRFWKVIARDIVYQVDEVYGPQGFMILIFSL